jgi:hypothetical protein
MARIIGGIGSSHTPTIGFALDTHKQADPAWAPIFAGYEPGPGAIVSRQVGVLEFQIPSARRCYKRGPGRRREGLGYDTKLGTLKDST